MEENLLKIIVKAIDDLQADDIKIIDISATSPLASYFVIATCDNQRKMNAIANNIDDEVARHGCMIKHIEGRNSSEWILVDAADVIVHLFSEEARQYYNLDRLYRNEKSIAISDILE